MSCPLSTDSLWTWHVLVVLFVFCCSYEKDRTGQDKACPLFCVLGVDICMSTPFNLFSNKEIQGKNGACISCACPRRNLLPIFSSEIRPLRRSDPLRHPLIPLQPFSFNLSEVWPQRMESQAQHGPVSSPPVKRNPFRKTKKFSE
jgi:hypothetical protein